MTLDPAVAACRLAVRRETADLEPGARVLVACSGGADSLALLAATVFEAKAGAWEVGGVSVDHGLQDGSAEHAQRVVEQMAALGAARTATVRVHVDPGGLGIEAAARRARYAALEEFAEREGADVVLLGHTLDDQAETVLLGLTRGSGGRSISGMRRRFGPFRRPLLQLTRVQTVAACAAEGIDTWTDPHNSDPRFTRARIRYDVLPVLERELGPGIAAALARTGELVREDLDALDDQAEDFLRTHPVDAANPGDPGLETADLAALPAAVRLRVLRQQAVAAGVPPSELTRTHLRAVDTLVTDYHGQRRIELPGKVHAYRQGPRLRWASAAVAG